jgi:hypothetical protein
LVFRVAPVVDENARGGGGAVHYQFFLFMFFFHEAVITLGFRL